jgi:hypothetical protein
MSNEMTLKEIEQLGHTVDQQHMVHTRGGQVFTGTLVELSGRIRAHEEHLARRDAEHEKARTAEDHRAIDQFLAAEDRRWKEVDRWLEFDARSWEEYKANGGTTLSTMRLESDRVHRRFMRAHTEALAHLERIKKLPRESLRSHKRLVAYLDAMHTFKAELGETDAGA